MAGPAAALAFGLGLGLPCLLAVGAAVFGWDVRGEVYGALAGLGFSAGLIVAAVVDGLIQRAERLADLRKSNALTKEIELKNAGRVAPVLAPTPSAPAAVVVRYAGGIVNGRPREPLEIKAEPRSARWTAWQLSAEDWLGWYKLLRTSTSGAMVGPHRAFDKPSDWVAFTNELDRVQVVDKMNGKRTVLRATLDATEASILSGEIEWSEAADPPAIRPPALPPTSVPVTVEGSFA